MKWSIARGLSWVHMSTGTDVSKTRWRTEERVYFDAIGVRRSSYSRLAYATYTAIVTAAQDDGVRSALQRVLPYRKLA
jgi:hypothetical protein